MRCLIAVDDPAVRAAVSSAARAFPDLEADACGLEDGRLLLRRRRFDFVCATLPGDTKESKACWDELLALRPVPELIALAPATGLSVRRADKGRLHLFALLGLPIDAVELFGTLRRIMDRVRKSRPAPSGARPG